MKEGGGDSVHFAVWRSHHLFIYEGTRGFKDLLTLLLIVESFFGLNASLSMCGLVKIITNNQDHSSNASLIGYGLPNFGVSGGILDWSAL